MSTPIPIPVPIPGTAYATPAAILRRPDTAASGVPFLKSLYAS